LKILCVSPFKPYPTLHGGTVDIWSQIAILLNLGHDVNLVFCTKEKTEFDKKHLSKEYDSFVNIYPVFRKNKIKDFFSKTPLQINSRKALSKVKLVEEYDLTILYSEYVIKILFNDTLKTKKVVLRVQNNEVKYFKELSKSTKKLIYKAYFRSESIKFRGLIRTLKPLIQSVWHISNDEIKKSHYSNNVLVPPAYNSSFKTQKLSTNTALFISSLHMENNLDALEWYLKGAHLLLCEKLTDYKLIVCGSATDNQRRKIQDKYKKHLNIDFYFNAPSLLKYYEESSVFINSMRHGAGVKLKSINAIVNGLPLVSTSTGAEGIGLKQKEMFRLANTQQEFFTEIISVFQENKADIQQMVTNAQNHLKKNAPEKVIEEQLKQ
tara:strand:+ start:457 stop:1593 length:1137 start_codon:yes stop_codon:yes gene_type:complete